MAESGLEALARGLRGAGGILNPQVQQMEEQTRQREDAQAEQRRNMMAQLTIKGAESGAIDPMKATETLKGLGFDVPAGSIGPTPEAMARKQQYQNEIAFRDEWGKLGDDATLAQRAGLAAKYGKPELSVQLFNAQEQRLDRAQARADALEKRRMELDAMSAQKDLDRESRERIEASRREATRLHEATLKEIAGMRAERETAKAEGIKDEKARVDARKLSADLNKAGLIETDASLSRVEDALRKAPGLAQAIATPNSLTPDWMLPKDIRNGKQDFQSLFNITLKNRSGAAVTNPELERLKAEFGSGAWKTPDMVINGVRRMREIITKHYAGIAAGYGKDVLNAYNKNLRDVGGSVVLEPKDEKEDPLGIL